MNLTDIIQKAVLSEKAYKQMEKGVYTFLIGKTVNKKEVARAVKKQFGTDAIKVNITNISPKTKRVTGTKKHTKVGGGKKAIVYLAKGQTIPALSPKTENKKEKKTKTEKTQKDKDVQASSIEGKEG